MFNKLISGKFLAKNLNDVGFCKEPLVLEEQVLAVFLPHLNLFEVIVEDSDTGDFVLLHLSPIEGESKILDL